MMRSFKKITSAVLVASTAVAFSAPAISAPLLSQAPIAKHAPSNVENVQYYRHGPRHHRPHYYGGHGYHRGPSAGAVIGGLAAGAIIGGAIAASQAQAAQQAAQQNHAYCAQRYRSYDPRSGTYLNNDGNRYPCP